MLPEPPLRPQSRSAPTLLARQQPPPATAEARIAAAGLDPDQRTALAAVLADLGGISPEAARTIAAEPGTRPVVPPKPAGPVPVPAAHAVRRTAGTHL